MKATQILTFLTASIFLFGITFAQTGIDTAGTLLVVANDGGDVWNQSGTSIVLVNNQTGASTTIRTGSAYSPSFSPDGRSICYFNGTSIYTANNDGTGVQKICDSYNNRSGRPTWCTDGYIWWSENTADVYRVNVSTKVRENYWPNCPAQGHDAVVVEALTVSKDGTRGESNGNGQVNALDLVNKTVVTRTAGGCAGAITSNGRYMIIQGTSPTTPGSTGGFNGTWIKDFTTGAQITYVNLPGSSTAYFHSGSKNNPDFFMARSLAGTYLGGAILVKISTQSSKAHKPSSGAWIPSDFWCGPLLSASTAPVIALNKTLLTFTASGTAPASQTVSVANTGAGTLTAVTVAKKTAWLTVTVSGTGNAQTLTSAVSATGLAGGAYRDTVTVSGGGASNSVTYAVNLTVGNAPAAPSNLVAVVVPGVQSSSVNLAWTDNSTNETQFIIERQTGTGAWAQRGTTAANTAVFADTGVAAGTYNYRVFARNSTGTSAASNTAAAVAVLQARVTITGPLSATSLRTGDTVYIAWTALNMTSVIIEYSIDDGITFEMMPGITGQLVPTDARWSHFPFKVPAAPEGTVHIRVTSYVNHSVFDLEGPYTVNGGTSVTKRSLAARAHAARIVSSPLRSIANVQALNASSSPVRIMRLDGACVGTAAVGGKTNKNVAAGRYVGRGR